MIVISYIRTPTKKTHNTNCGVHKKAEGWGEGLKTLYLTGIARIGWYTVSDRRRKKRWGRTRWEGRQGNKDPPEESDFLLKIKIYEKKFGESGNKSWIYR